MLYEVITVLADAECLPFAPRSFHCVTIGFGLRNVTDKDAALRSLYRVTKPGGRTLVLEFSHAQLGPLAPLYELYSRITSYNVCYTKLLRCSPMVS